MQDRHASTVGLAPRRCGTLTSVGDWSYSIYLWHVPIILVVTGWCRAHRIDPLRLGPTGKEVAITSIALATILLAAVSYQWLEQPARRLLRVRRDRRPAGLSATPNIFERDCRYAGMGDRREGMRQAHGMQSSPPAQEGSC